MTSMQGARWNEELDDGEVTLETAGGTKKRSPAKFNEDEDEQPPLTLPPPSHGKRKCALFTPPPLTGDGQTPLHLICQDPRTSIEAVRASLEEYPGVAKIADVYGRTAIFYALKRGCLPEVVQLVFAAYPTGVVMRDFCGESGLYLLYHPSKHPRILKSILSQQPSLALHRSNSFSNKELVHQVCDPWTNTLDLLTPASDDASWIKLVITVQAAHRARFHETHAGVDVDEMKDDDLLHMALELQLSPTLIYHFARLYPEQARRPMPPRVGLLLPLQYVVQQTRFATDKGTSSLIRLLIQECPEAVTLPCLGGGGQSMRLLKVALSNNFRWSNGVKELVYACPDALHEPDPVSNLLPFMMASVAALTTAGMEGDVNTVFCLLREAPLLRRFL